MSHLSEPVAVRALCVGDSNLVYCAEHVVQASQHYPSGTPAPVVSCDFAAAVPGTGLRDLSALESRIGSLDLADYDCAIVSLGAADIILEDANWSSFFAGPPSYHTRIEALLDALGPLPVYWIGVPSGMASPPCHPFEVAAVDLALVAFDADYPGYAVSGYSQTERMRYVNPDAILGTLSPRFTDGFHYTAAAATALYTAVFARILSEV